MTHQKAHGRATRALAIATAAGVAFGVAPLTGVAAATAEAEEAKTPKNIIVMISDGGGYAQYDSARAYTSGTTYQQVTVDPATGTVEKAESTPSEVYDEWPVQLSESHYSANGRGFYSPELAWSYTPEEAAAGKGWVAEGATDSAAAGTALGTGVKTNNGTIGIDPAGEQLLTVGEQASAVGKEVGLVTSVPFNHATPAGFIAHNADRNDYHGLATEMIDSDADVIIGGGHPNYTDSNTSRPSKFDSKAWISQTDFERLTQGETQFSYIESKADFEAIANGEDVPEKLFGLARVAETFQFNRGNPLLPENKTEAPFTDKMNADVPSLATSAKAALNVLENDEEGFFLMVEGGAVDWAGHANSTTRMVEEQVAFNESVDAVNAWVEQNSSWEETLVIVTADHETGYMGGPGAKEKAGWTPVTGEKGMLPEVSWQSGGHTNSLVPLYAKGAGSEILQTRADNWDFVRGAYLDNTDIGKTLFDLIGHAVPGADSDAVGVEATVPLPMSEGSLSLTVPALQDAIAFAGDATTQTAALPEVTVNDSRNEVQAQGKGWTLSGSATPFIAGNREFGAEALAWAPKVIATERGAVAGGTATLEAPAVLADSGRESRVGETVVGADLTLTVPETADSGRYGSEITLTLFPKD